MNEQEIINSINTNHELAVLEHAKENSDESLIRKYNLKNSELRGMLEKIRHPKPQPRQPTQEEIEHKNRITELRTKLKSKDLTNSEINELLRQGGF